MDKLLKALESLLQSELLFPNGNFRRVIIENDMGAPGRLSPDQIPAILIYPAGSRQQPGPFGNTATVFYRIVVRLLTAAYRNPEEARFAVKRGIFPLSDTVEKAIATDKTLGGSARGLEVTWQVDDTEEVIIGDGRIAPIRDVILEYHQIVNWCGAENSSPAELQPI